MSRFYIKQITASGSGVEFSKIDFESGVNIIYGPSNSGKSYIIGCINFMLGGDIPFTKESTGYDTIGMELKSDDGYSIRMTRQIVDGKNGETGAGKVDVVSDYPGVDSQEYNTWNNDYSDMLLSLIGVKEHHKIIAKENFVQENFSVRQMIHLLYLDEEHIFKKDSALLQPKMKKVNASMSILHFLLTGDDLSQIVPEESEEERNERLTKKAGVLMYLNDKIGELTKRKEEMEQIDVDFYSDEIAGKIDQLMAEIEDVERQIHNAASQGKELLKQIYETSAKLEEARFLQDRYKSLRSQYQSDIKRLKFIKDGEIKSKDVKPVSKCPFCNHDIEDTPDTHKSYLESSDAELHRIEIQMEDLNQAENGIDRKISILESEMRKLNERHDDVDALISKELQPKASELKRMLQAYKSVQETQKRFFAITSMADELQEDIRIREIEDDPDKLKYEGRKQVGEDTWKELSDSFSNMVEACGYPNFLSARIDYDTLDAKVGNKFKKDEGKGFRAFLNTIMLFNLMHYLGKKAVYAPRLLVLDSPILSLKEKKYKISEKEKATAGMRESLFRYIVENCGDNQIIIAENEIPEGVDYSSAHMLEFTLDPDNGVYGFLKSVTA